MLLIRDKPPKVVDTDSRALLNRGESDQELSVAEEPKATNGVNFFNAWLLPGVALYALAFVCLKGTYLGLLYWLPSYIQNYSNLET